jgi:DNA-binding IclR family transcriptional regulator
MARHRARAEESASSGDRLLAVLALFTIERPEWTVDAAASELGVSATTAYRYFNRLTKAGLISPVSGASYALGPAIIQMDRQIQICDPMLNAARAVMADLIQYAAEGSIVLLCRLFHDRVMCMHQVIGRGPQMPVSYERGRLMPLYRGATAKIILAHLPARALKSLYAHDAAEIAAAGLGKDWDEFRGHLAALRRQGVVVSMGEIDPGRVGIAAPIFDRDRAVLGSLSFVLPAARADEVLIGRLAPLTGAGAREIERAMNHESAPSQPSPARLKMAR